MLFIQKFADEFKKEIFPKDYRTSFKFRNKIAKMDISKIELFIFIFF